MKLSYNHGVTKDRAMEVLKAHGDLLTRNMAPQVSDVRQEWHANGLNVYIKVFGMTIESRMVVDERTVEVEVDLPMIARAREGEVRSRALRALEEAFAGENQAKEQTQ